MENINIKISENDKQILKSVAPALIILVLFFVVGKFGIGQITNLRNQITEVKKIQSLLSSKYDILSRVSQLSETGSNAALIALPKSNPAIQVQSQIKSLVLTNMLVVDSIKSSLSVSDSGLSYVTSNVEISGPKEGVIAFVKSIDTIAPVTLVSKVDFDESGDIAKATIVTKTFFAPLPKTIPTVTQAVTDLTSDERSLLSEISNLSQPAFSEITPELSGGINPNPFGQ